MKCILLMLAVIAINSCAIGQKSNQAVLEKEREGAGQDVKTETLNPACSYKATLLDSVMSQFRRQTHVKPGDADIRYNAITGRERIDFLNADFKTSAFSAACEVRCVDFISATGTHLGIINMGIQPTDKEKCLRAIKASGRQNFRIKVLTRFRVIERRSELVIIYSETPNVPVVKNVLEAI